MGLRDLADGSTPPASTSFSCLLPVSCRARFSRARQRKLPPGSFLALCSMKDLCLRGPALRAIIPRARPSFLLQEISRPQQKDRQRFAGSPSRGAAPEASTPPPAFHATNECNASAMVFVSVGCKAGASAEQGGPQAEGANNAIARLEAGPWGIEFTFENWREWLCRPRWPGAGRSARRSRQFLRSRPLRRRRSKRKPRRTRRRRASSLPPGAPGGLRRAIEEDRRHVCPEVGTQVGAPAALQARRGPVLSRTVRQIRSVRPRYA